MRKILLIIALMGFVSQSGFSQMSRDSLIEARNKYESLTNSYLTVKGVSLKPGLKMKDLLNLFIAKGWKKSEFFDYFEENRGTYVLKGSFFGYQDRDIIIQPTKTNKNIVGIVGISFPDVDSFKELKSTYDDLKASLQEKYEIVECIEKFDDEFLDQSTSDYLKLSAIRNNEATFQTEFHLGSLYSSILMGRIILSMACINNQSIHVSLAYYTSDFVIEQLDCPNPKDDL